MIIKFHNAGPDIKGRNQISQRSNPWEENEMSVALNGEQINCW